MEKLILHTGRLLIRNLNLSDLRSFHAYRSNPEVTKYQGFDVFSEKQAVDFIKEQAGKEFGKPGEWVQYGIENKASGQLTGDCAIKLDGNDTRLAEIGITISPNEQKKGYAKETLLAILDFLFSRPGFHRVTETVDKTYYILSGEFVSPSEKYSNSKYDLVKNNPYYTELLKVYKTRNKVRPVEKRLKHGIIPQDYKGGFDKAYEAGLDPKEQANNILQHLKSKWGIRETDNQLGLTNLQGDEHKYLPLYYTTFIEEDQVSLDLLQSVLQFSQMSNTWETLNKAEPYMRAILDIAQGNTTLEIKQRSMTKGTNGLKELYDRNIPKKANRANEQLI